MQTSTKLKRNNWDSKTNQFLQLLSFSYFLSIHLATQLFQSNNLKNLFFPLLKYTMEGLALLSFLHWTVTPLKYDVYFKSNC